MNKCDCEECYYWDLRYKNRNRKLKLIQWWLAPGWKKSAELRRAIKQLENKKK